MNIILLLLCLIGLTAAALDGVRSSNWPPSRHRSPSIRKRSQSHCAKNRNKPPSGSNMKSNNNNSQKKGKKNKDSSSCPDLHIFGARETTAPPGFGTASVLVDLVLDRFGNEKSGDRATVTSEAIEYPAAGGEQYGASVGEGIRAVVKQTSEFAKRCPASLVVMHGYSQGAQIIDDAFCGGPDLPSLNSSNSLVSLTIARNTAAIILMGNPRHVDGLPFNVGNATVGGFAARPATFRCPQFEARIQAYCDSPDPFCSNGTDPDTHQGYGLEYGDDALEFILGRLRPGVYGGI